MLVGRDSWKAIYRRSQYLRANALDRKSGILPVRQSGSDLGQQASSLSEAAGLS